MYFHSKKHVKYINQIILSNKDNWILLENLVEFLVSKKCTKPSQATINSKKVKVIRKEHKLEKLDYCNYYYKEANHKKVSPFLSF